MPKLTRAVDCHVCGERVDAHENGTLLGNIEQNVTAALAGREWTPAKVAHEGCAESGKNRELGEF